MNDINNDTIKRKYTGSWKDTGFDANLQRPAQNQVKQAQYIKGASFDALLDELMFNRVIKLKDLRVAPQGNEPGKIYWDGQNKKYKIWIDATGGWADIPYTTTSTSTSTTSSSSSTSISTSTSTTSTSTSTT